MEMIYFTIAAVVLYVVSDWILNRLEIRRGARYENRSLIFFVIITVLALISFNVIQHFYRQESAPADNNSPPTKSSQQTIQ